MANRAVDTYKFVSNKCEMFDSMFVLFLFWSDMCVYVSVLIRVWVNMDTIYIEVVIMQQHYVPKILNINIGIIKLQKNSHERNSDLNKDTILILFWIKHVENLFLFEYDKYIHVVEQVLNIEAINPIVREITVLCI